MSTKKVAISMPEPMFREMEHARKRRASERSAWVQGAIAERLRLERNDVEATAYARGYALYPETDEDIARAETSARALFEALDAEDGGWPGASR